jgi:outer membrane receptor protein involved in Fe transport
MTWRCPAFTRAFLLASTALAFGGALPALAQQAPPADEPKPDVIVVVGSQIVGAKPTEALAVNVVRREEIDAIAAPSGDELFRSIPQMGDVGFNSASSASTVGGVNAARGDVASINLRALGTGNTLVLLNGRRMVNHPGVQVENSVPVVTVNANTIPVAGVDRVEVLLDGASAIYGSDAVAGVVNTVLKSDFSGLTVELQGGKEQGVDAAEFSGSLEWGYTSDDGRTNVSLLGSFFSRDPIYASERSFSASADNRSRMPADWANGPSAQAAFNNTSLTSAWGIFDRFTPGTITVNGTAITNAAGQFHLQPADLANCSVTYINGTCFSQTSTRPQALRYDINRGATVQNGVDRENLYLTFRHRFDERLEMFGEAGAYLADSLGYREEAPMLGAVPIVIPASNYWNPFGPITFANGQPNPNRLPGTNAPAQGFDLVLGSLTGSSAYRLIDAGPRKTEVENVSTRVVFGLRGDVANWNWESAVLYSQADTEDKENRISNTLFQQQLALSTPDAYNPFNGGCLADLAAGDCTPSSQAAIDAITVPVMRRSKTSLASWDFKVSRPDALRIWSGDVGVAAGVELRREDYRDDRDPRQDGSVSFIDAINPAIRTNDLMGQSASLDTSGKRDVTSAWVEVRAPLVSPEMNVPLVKNVDLQLAGRYEDFDTFGDVTKPKVALSWRPFDFLMFRSAWSEGFRAPNLQQEFEAGLVRNNNRVDFIFCQAAKALDPSIVITPTACTRPAGAPAATAQVTSLLALGASKPVTSNRHGSTALQPEDSKNLTYGAVFEPTFLPDAFGKLTLTADWWRIEQTGVVGIFTDSNHILLDYALRAQGLGSDSAVVRTTPDAARDTLFSGTGIAAVGDISIVNDNYLNLDQRTVQGWDFGLYYSLPDTRIGSFDFRANASFLDKFYQGVSPDGAVINAAAAAGKIAPISVAGQGDQVKNFGRPEWRWTASLTWSFAAWQAGWFTSYVGDVNDDFTVRSSDGAIWNIDSMQTHNLYVQYTLGPDHKGTRLRLGMRNIFDEQPPLAATTFGYLGDIDNPAGRFLYGSIRKTF